jgi:outer membrane protein
MSEGRLCSWPRAGESAVWTVGKSCLMYCGVAAIGVASAFLSGCAGAAVNIESKIALVDFQKLYEESNAGKKAKGSLEVYAKNRQTLIDMEEKELRRLQEDFERQRTVLSPEALRERGEQFQRRVAEAQQKSGMLTREVQEKQRDVMEAFRDKVEIVVSKVAKRSNLHVVMDLGRNGPTFYHEKGLDITNQVIEEFNREFP